MAVFPGGVGSGDLANLAIPVLGVSLDNAVAWRQPTDGSDIAVLGALSYAVNTTTLGHLTRTMKCDGVSMASLGVQAWDDADGGGWTEVFGIVGVDPGNLRISASVQGADVSQRVIRGSSVAYTGADSFTANDPVSGNGTTLSVAGNASPASMIAAFFGTRSGLAAANQTQRYLSNTATALLISEGRGTGTSFNLTATRALAGPWSAQSVVINPADGVASVRPLVIAPRITTAAAARLPRPSGPRRVIFDVELED